MKVCLHKDLYTNVHNLDTICDGWYCMSTGSWGTQISGQTGFWVCLDEINIWIARLCKADCPPNLGGPHRISWRHEEDKKADSSGRRREFSCLMAFKMGHCFSPAFRLKLTQLALPGFQTYCPLELMPPALLGLQLVDCRSWHLFTSIII